MKKIIEKLKGSILVPAIALIILVGFFVYNLQTCISIIEKENDKTIIEHIGSELGKASKAFDREYNSKSKLYVTVSDTILINQQVSLSDEYKKSCVVLELSELMSKQVHYLSLYSNAYTNGDYKIMHTYRDSMIFYETKYDSLYLTYKKL